MAVRATFETAEDIVERYGMIQRKNNRRLMCPRCGCDKMHDNLHLNALSRRADVYVCSDCGTAEAMCDFFGVKDDLNDWTIVPIMKD